MVISSEGDPDKPLIPDKATGEDATDGFPIRRVVGPAIKVLSDEGAWTHRCDRKGGVFRKCVGSHEVMKDVFAVGVGGS